jgi:hypothetical protein
MTKAKWSKSCVTYIECSCFIFDKACNNITFVRPTITTVFYIKLGINSIFDNPTYTPTALPNSEIPQNNP